MSEHNGPVRAVLIGPPGAGKSTAGELLAQRWGVEFVDTDREVERAKGMPVAQIFLDDGEPAFREEEARQVEAALSSGGPARVVALGGGAVMAEAAQRHLQGHRVVLLTVGIADAAKRTGLDRTRPLLGMNPRASWVRLADQRRATYEAAASVSVDTSGRTPDEVVEQILAALGAAAG